MTDEKTLAFDVETRLLASEVAEEHAEKLAGESPWSRPDLFGFGCGVVVDLGTGVAYRYRDAAAMLSHLREANVCVSYNGEAFDLGVISAYGDVENIRAKHIDINVLVREGLDDLPEAQQPGVDRLRQGGLDGLARTNGLQGKTGDGTAIPQMLREGRVEEVLEYCEHDARLVARLYRLGRERGELRVEAYYRDEHDGERVYLPAPVYVPLTV